MWGYDVRSMAEVAARLHGINLKWKRKSSTRRRKCIICPRTPGFQGLYTYVKVGRCIYNADCHCSGLA